MNPLMVQFLVVNFSMHAESDTSVTLDSGLLFGWAVVLEARVPQWAPCLSASATVA